MDNLTSGESVPLRPVVLVPAADDRDLVPLRGQMEAYLADHLGNRRKIGMEVLVDESDFHGPGFTFSLLSSIGGQAHPSSSGGRSPMFPPPGSRMVFSHSPFLSLSSSTFLATNS